MACNGDVVRRLWSVFVLALSLAAQEPQYGVDARLVMVPVTVTDARGRIVDGLGASDFRIYDEGKVQNTVVDTIATGVAPIALIIAVQSSGISAPALAKIRKIGAAIGPLVTGEHGCAALAAFDERITWLQECTSDQDALSTAFRRLEAGEYKAARLLDAAAAAVERLRRYPNHRRVLLLISETRDRGSETPLDAVARDAAAAGVTIYAAPYSAFSTAFTFKPDETARPPVQDGPGAQRTPPPPPPSAPTMANAPVPRGAGGGVDLIGAIGELARVSRTKTTEELTKATGGASFPFTRLAGLENAITRLGHELHTQYVLSFVPDSPAGGYHRLEVRVNRPGTFKVRARPGYWATSVPR